MAVKHEFPLALSLTFLVISALSVPAFSRSAGAGKAIGESLRGIVGYHLPSYSVFCSLEPEAFPAQSKYRSLPFAVEVRWRRDIEYEGLWAPVERHTLDRLSIASTSEYWQALPSDPVARQLAFTAVSSALKTLQPNPDLLTSDSAWRVESVWWGYVWNGLSVLAVLILGHGLLNVMRGRWTLRRASQSSPSASSPSAEAPGADAD